MAVNLEMIPESFLPIQLAEQFDTRFDLTELLSSFVVVVDDDDERRGEEIGFCVWMFSFFPSLSLFFSFLRWKWQGYPEYIRVISRMIMPSSAISDMDSDIILRRKWTKRNQFLSRRFFPRDFILDFLTELLFYGLLICCNVLFRSLSLSLSSFFFLFLPFSSFFLLFFMRVCCCLLPQIIDDVLLDDSAVANLTHISSETYFLFRF